MNHGKFKILVVEDDVLAAKMALINLSQLNCNTTIARTGTEAIKMFRQDRYDLIFMDLGLPDIDGLTVTETIRKLEKESNTHIPVISLTAHISDEVREQSLAVGMDDFLSKPLTVDNVQTMIDRYIKKSVIEQEEKTQHFFSS